MPILRVQLIEGRTQEQKQALVEGLTKVVCETCDQTPDRVRILLEEMPKENYAIGGVFIKDQL